jgi:hypothetical protein
MQTRAQDRQDGTVRRPWAHAAAPRELPFQKFSGIARGSFVRMIPARACRTLSRSHVRLLETLRVIQEDACLRESIVRLPLPPCAHLHVSPGPLAYLAWRTRLFRCENAKRHSRKLGTLPSEHPSTPRAIAFTCLTL